MFKRLSRAAFAVKVRVSTAFANKGYDAEAYGDLCRSYRMDPRLQKRGQSRENKRPGLSDELLGSTRYDRFGFIVERLLHATCILLVASRLTREF